MKQAFQCVLQCYKRFVSPVLPHACRFVPTCSEYAMEAIERHGVFRGSALAAGRLLRCHPFARAGYDPPPQQFRRRDLGAPDAVPAATSAASVRIQQGFGPVAGYTKQRTLAASHHANARVGRQC